MSFPYPSVSQRLIVFIGVYIPSNEGRLKVSFSYCMLGSMVCLPLTLLYGPDTLYNTALAASFTAGWNTEWKRQPDTGGLCGRLFWLSVIGCLYMGKQHLIVNGCVRLTIGVP